ncbi:biotin-dependent carboxyltransferase family protein [Lewinella sp. IMCC34183]|uniref:biotin-dependent carboxyltransferase family protein n=1 Tax=Lewinella sp. IMCC34183 TaxID=2248762 RepID=UPI0013009134|nr:biotin-dependent carboxyltransferase family protein [Lewinella sp. IMCC34183]
MARTLTVECAGHGRGIRFVDGGRPGYRHLGIGGGEAADRGSAAAANRILGQEAFTCCIEGTLTGGHWLLSGRGQLALTGADVNWQLDGRPVARYQTIFLDGQHELRGGTTRGGCRAYVAIRGMWDLPRVLGSVAPGLPGAVEPARGTRFTVRSESESPYRLFWTEAGEFPQRVAIPVVPGPEWRLLTARQGEQVLESEYRVGTASDRQGVRLECNHLPELNLPELISSPVLPGTVQWTPTGPVLLGPDAQTVGGYPRLLLAAPLPDGVFQLLPGGRVHFAGLTVNP